MSYPIFPEAVFPMASLEALGIPSPDAQAQAIAAIRAKNLAEVSDEEVVEKAQNDPVEAEHLYRQKNAANYCAQIAAGKFRKPYTHRTQE